LQQFILLSKLHHTRKISVAVIKNQGKTYWFSSIDARREDPHRSFSIAWLNKFLTEYAAYADRPEQDLDYSIVEHHRLQKFGLEIQVYSIKKWTLNQNCTSYQLSDWMYLLDSETTCFIHEWKKTIIEKKAQWTLNKWFSDILCTLKINMSRNDGRTNCFLLMCYPCREHSHRLNELTSDVIHPMGFIVWNGRFMKLRWPPRRKSNSLEPTISSDWESTMRITGKNKFCLLISARSLQQSSVKCWIFLFKFYCKFLPFSKLGRTWFGYILFCCNGAASKPVK